MNIEEIREYCLSFPGTTENFPFDQVTLVFKVMGKIFCMMNLDGEPGLYLKNTPEKIAEMQERYAFVLPAYHMNKVHWFIAEVSIAPGPLLKHWISESRSLVIRSLTRLKKQELNTLSNDERV